MGISNLKIKNLAVGGFIAALAVYACWGSPTPDAPGVIEAIIVLLMALALLLPAVGALRRFKLRHALLYYGLTFPFIAGALAGNPAIAIARDMAAFLFLMLPLLAAPLFESHPQRLKILTAAFTVLGLAFSLRAILDAMAVVPQDLTYFANTSGVLFSCVFLMGVAAQEKYKIVTPVFLCALSFLPWLAMSLTLQRASLGYAMLAAVYFLCRTCRQRRWGFIAPLLVLALGFILWPNLMDLYGHLAAKTVLFGGNMRWQEATEVWRDVSQSPLNVIFGKGWGGSFESPAVAGIRVNYTHNLLTAMFLKTGLIGLGLTGAYLLIIARKLIPMIRQDFALTLALAGPFFIGAFLYASYKSLDYGILLLLIVVRARTHTIASLRQDV